MEDSEILNLFIEQELNIHPEALCEIKKKGDANKTICEIISKIQRTGDRPSILTLDYIEYINSIDGEDGQNIVATAEGNGEAMVEEPQSEVIIPAAPTEEAPEIQTQVEENNLVSKGTKTRSIAEEYSSDIVINEEKDITNRSYSEGNIEGFVGYFNDRYEKIGKALRERERLRDAATIEWIKRSAHRENLRAIGIVNDIRKSRKGNTIIELEDPTGVIPVIILSTNYDLIKVSKSIVKDEVIGVEGNGGKDNEIILAKEIFFPDLPINREPNRSPDPLALATVSDVHAGSTEFLEDVFSRFIRWLKGDMGTKSQRALAGRVKYLLICGDLVDGVGIYPGQEEELVIKDIHSQYQCYKPG